LRSDDPRFKLIFALDVEHFDQAIHWVKMLKDHVGIFKVGSQLFTHSGPKIIEWIHRQGKKVFVDLKYHDIPNTVARASEELTKLGVEMFNVHALGGYIMMKETMKAVIEKAKDMEIRRPKVFAVTILTSLDQKDIEILGFSGSIQDHVLSLARLSKEAGLDGVIASPQDIHILRSSLGKDFMIITPGIRISMPLDDQKRVMTPKEAIDAGADFIVLGREIRNSLDPVKTIEKLVSDIQ
jgi:orotidine-5'-phosphate decarboxylase